MKDSEGPGICADRAEALGSLGYEPGTAGRRAVYAPRTETWKTADPDVGTVMLYVMTVLLNLVLRHSTDRANRKDRDRDSFSAYAQPREKGKNFFRRQRTRTERQVTQPSSFSNSLTSTRTTV